MNTPATNRPALSPELSGGEFRRWYWLKDELVDFARSTGLKTTGSKALLTQRIAAALDGEPFTEPQTAKRTTVIQLAEPLSGSTMVPAGQRCSQVVRTWMSRQIGSGFHFDAPMRQFFAAADGTQTLQDAVDHWHNTRNAGRQDIDPQFEYNRFTRAWHCLNPMGNREQLLSAWNVYRSQPADQRGRI